ncbi:MAG: hypothetical protein WAS56_01950 [Saprospiraceae bacterium]|nr:hypothetical protein [Saprospiraceae bacterium]
MDVFSDYKLKDVDKECIEDLLLKVEVSFDIQFIKGELYYIGTFGELCDHINNKIKLETVDDCTSQQAFYKLRNALSKTLQIETKTISVNHLLKELLPRRNRRSKITTLEENLGIKLNILRPPYWVTRIILIAFLFSVVGLFFNFQIGFAGLMCSIIGFWISIKIGNEFDLESVGQVAEKMCRENYLQSRRNPKTFNRSEIEKVLIDWFSLHLSLERSKLTKDAILQVGIKN